jgi:hypothetical protein
MINNPYICKNKRTMKIELKSIKTYERLSKETTCFTANLYVDNKLLAHVENGGNGGNTSYSIVKLTDKEKLRSVESYCESLPDIICNFSDKEFTVKSNLEIVIDDLLEKHLLEKDQKRMYKNMEKGLVYGNVTDYSIITWKNHTIASLLATPAGKTLLTKKVEELKSKGITVLNTNL